MRIQRKIRLVFAATSLLALAQFAAAQSDTPAPAVAPATQTAEPVVPTPQPAVATPEPVPQAAVQSAVPAAAPATEPAAAVPVAEPAPAGQAAVVPAAAAAAKPKPSVAKGSAKKVEYTGPTTVIVLSPTPMLDGEGKQRMDPDGKLMFNAPVSQQRDKKGHPLFDEQGKPVFQTATELGYDEHGHHLHIQKEKPPKMTPVSISRGTFTVDGMIGKAELNYDIADLKFIYLYAPIIGTVVVSNEPFEGAKEEKAAFNDTTLTVNIGDHVLQVASEKRLLGKKPESAYVLLDRDFKLPSKYPVVGYGPVMKAPYAWPGGRPNPVVEAAIMAPPVPQNLRPVMLLSPCPAGQMRKPAPKVLPGEVAPEQPCIPIEKAVATQTVAGKTTPVVAPANSTTPAATTPPAAPEAKTGSPQ